MVKSCGWFPAGAIGVLTLLGNMLFPKPKPKLFVGAFFGEKMPPPGPSEPAPVIV